MIAPDPIRAFVEQHHHDLPSDAQYALTRLIATMAKSGDVTAGPVVAALDDYLDVMGAPELKAPPARSYAEACMSLPSQIANFEFYRRGSVDLSEAQRMQLQRCVIDRFCSEAWPIPPRVARPSKAPSAAPPARASFGQAAYQNLMAKFFRRDLVYEVNREVLTRLLEEVTAALESAMNEADLSPDERSQYREQLKTGYGLTIQNYLAKVDRGETTPQLVHFVG